MEKWKLPFRVWEGSIGMMEKKMETTIQGSGSGGYVSYSLNSLKGVI